MKVIHEFRLWCNIDNKYVTTYGPTPPTKCPNDTSHTIDKSKTVIEDTSDPKVTTIKEYNDSLGGYYKVKGELMVIPEKPVLAGKTTNETGVSDTVLEVDDAVINIITLDVVIQLRHANGVTKLGKIIIIDKKNKQITIMNDMEYETYDKVIEAGAAVEIITTCKDFVQPIDVGVLSYSYNSTMEHMGDSLEVQVYPNLLIGAITSFVKTGDSTINVSPTVIQNIKVGFYCRLDDGEVIECLGIVTNVDTVNSQISVSKPAINNFSPFNPTLVKLTVKTLEVSDIGPPYRTSTGLDKLGSSIIRQNFVVRVFYVNNSVNAKRFTFIVGYIY